MGARVYTAPVRMQLRGNREEARKLERDARIKVAYVVDSMRPGETFKTGSWSLADGSKIMAFVWNDVLGKRATVRLTAIGADSTSRTYTFTIEHGLLSSDSLPASVYIDDSIRAHFEREIVIQGEVTVGDPYYLTSLGAPEIVDGDYYLSSIYTEDGVSKPADLYNRSYWYSGLGEKFIQAVFGSGMEDKFPGHAVDSTLIRSPSGDYWYVVGFRAIKMRIPSGLDLVERAIRENLISNEDEPFYQALVLGNLEFTEDKPQSEWLPILNEGALDFEDDIDDAEKMRVNFWEWQWARQERGAPDEFTPQACKILIHRVDDGAEKALISKTALVTIDWDEDNNPKPVDVEVTDSDKWLLSRVNDYRTSTLEVYYSSPYDNRMAWWHEDKPNEWYLSVNWKQSRGSYPFRVPLAAFYLKSGELSLVEFEQEAGVIESIYETDVTIIYGAGEHSYTRDTYYSSWAANVYIAGEKYVSYPYIEEVHQTCELTVDSDPLEEAYWHYWYTNNGYYITIDGTQTRVSTWDVTQQMPSELVLIFGPPGCAHIGVFAQEQATYHFTGSQTLGPDVVVTYDVCQGCEEIYSGRPFGPIYPMEWETTDLHGTYFLHVSDKDAIQVAENYDLEPKWQTLMNYTYWANPGATFYDVLDPVVSYNGTILYRDPPTRGLDGSWKTTNGLSADAAEAVVSTYKTWLGGV